MKRSVRMAVSRLRHVLNLPLRRVLPIVLIFLIALPVTVLAIARTQVYTIGVAPLLGECQARERLMVLADQKQNLLREAVRQAGHSSQVAELVVEALRLGQVKSTNLH